MTTRRLDGNGRISAPRGRSLAMSKVSHPARTLGALGDWLGEARRWQGHRMASWFAYQLIEANFGRSSAYANGGGVALFAHVGGSVFGLLAARFLARAGQAAPGSNGAPRRSTGDGGADRPRIRYSQY